MSTSPRQHTPGPWIAKPYEVLCGSEEICRAPLVVCLDGLGCEAGPRWQSNARLISAAPELLAALECILRRYDSAGVQCYPEAMREVIAARAAIARATGGNAS